MTTAAQTVTDADLLALPRDGHKRELVDGVVRVTPAGARHGAVALRLGARMLLHASERRLGEVFDSSTGYRLPSGNLRVPDVSFVTAHRLPGGKVPTGFFELAPDLAVEVLSPSDQLRDILDRVGEYLQSGSRLVWVLDPEDGSVAVHRSLTQVRRIGREGLLDGEDVLPGFSCRITEILEHHEPQPGMEQFQPEPGGTDRER